MSLESVDATMRAIHTDMLKLSQDCAARTAPTRVSKAVHSDTYQVGLRNCLETLRRLKHIRSWTDYW